VNGAIIPGRRRLAALRGIMWFAVGSRLMLGSAAPGAARRMPFRIPPHVMLCTSRALGPRAFNQRLKEMTDPLDVLRQFNDYGDIYDEVTMATTWSRLGRARGRLLGLIRSHDGEQLHALRDRTLQEADSWKARSLANTAHAFAKLQLQSE
jgi:hypothetical protein